MPGLVAHPERILLRVTDVQVAEIDQALEFIRLRKLFAEIPVAKSFLADIEITDRMVGMTWRRQRVGSE